MRPNHEQTSRPPILPRLALILMAALVSAEVTILHTLRDPDVATPNSVGAPRGAGAATDLVLDLLLCLPAMLVVLNRVIDREYRLRFNWASVAFASLAALALASSLWASDHFAAVVSSMQLVGAAALFWAAVQTVRTWIDVRIVTGVCFGLLAACVAQGVVYQLVDLPDDIRYWEQNRTSELARRGWDPDSFMARKFDIKVRNGEAHGFNTSPNSFAAVLVLLGLIGAGASIQRMSDRDESGWAGALLIPLIPGMWILWKTGSKTAGATIVLGAALFVLAPLLAKHRRRAYFAGVAGVVVGTIALVGLGLSRGSLLHPSLTFRWRYWVGAARIFQAHWLAGTGWENFGQYYLAARLPIASEEIRDPHNLIIRAAAELGIVGALLMIGWLARVFWEMNREIALPDPPARLASTRPSSAAKIALSIVLLTFAINVAASVDFNVTSVDRGWFLLLEIFRRGLYFILELLGIGLVLLRSSKEPVLDERPARWIACSLAIATGMFLLQNAIDFSLFEPGPMCLLAMVGGAAVGIRSRESQVEKSSRTGAAVAMGLINAAWIVAAVGLVIPIVIAERTAQAGDDLTRAGDPRAAVPMLRNAFETLWIPNSDYAFRAAMAMQYAHVAPDLIRPILDQAVIADPMFSANYRLRAELALRPPNRDVAAAIADLKHALMLDPDNISLRQELADALAIDGQKQAAIAEFRESLRYNDLLAPDEPKRLSATQVDQIEQRIRLLGI